MQARNPSDEELWEACRRLPSDWEPHGSANGTVGGKHAPIAIPAGGSWNSSALRLTGACAPIRADTSLIWCAAGTPDRTYERCFGTALFKVTLPFTL